VSNVSFTAASAYGMAVIDNVAQSSIPKLARTEPGPFNT
jgi:hypothetical protein